MNDLLEKLIIIDNNPIENLKQLEALELIFWPTDGTSKDTTIAELKELNINLNYIRIKLSNML